MKGRFPSNLIIDKATAKLLDEQSGELDSGGPSRKPPGTYKTKEVKKQNCYGKYKHGQPIKAPNDSGGASRFFHIYDEVENNKIIKESMKERLYIGDCLEILPTLEANSIDTIITDPPYGLEFMGKDWDRGVPGVHFWEEALRVLKPGGYLLAFGGTRTHHRLMVAIEDAGFEIRDCMMWLYGSGFPKAHDISKAIDKEAGEEREVVGSKLGLPGYSQAVGKGGLYGGGIGANGDGVKECQITAPATPAAAEWDGWKTALKPAWEPIVVAMKPTEGTFAQNAIKHGVAGLWIDGGRIGTEERVNVSAASNKIYGQFKGRETDGRTTQGRFPSNILLDEVAAAMLDEQSGELTSGERKPQLDDKPQTNCFGKYAKKNIGYFPSDSGGASRFFYTGKASPNERGNYNTHPTVKPVDLMQYLVKLTKTPTGGTVLDMFAGSGTTGLACQNEGRDYILIELDPNHCEIIERRLRDNYGMFCNLEIIR